MFAVILCIMRRLVPWWLFTAGGKSRYGVDSYIEIEKFEAEKAEKSMWFFRVLGWLFLFACLAVLVGDGVSALQTGTFRFVAAGELWYRLDAGSLNLLQALIEQYVSTWLWDKVFVPGLLLPAFLLLLVPGVSLSYLARRRRRPRYF